MKNVGTVLRIIICSVAVGLFGCSYIQSMFPDKERDYQYTTEIPMINYPPELRKNSPYTGLASTTAEAPTSSVNSENGETVSKAEDANQSATENSSSEDSATEDPQKAQPVPNRRENSTELTPADEADERDTVSSVQVIKYDDGESRLRLGAGFSKTWRVVNKALTRNTIEVTKREYENAQITVQFDPDEQKAKDEGFMDEISFLFKGINSHDKEYILKLEAHGQDTDVITLNEERLPHLNDEASLRLLKVLADTIKADLVGKVK